MLTPNAFERKRISDFFFVTFSKSSWCGNDNVPTLRMKLRSIYLNFYIYKVKKQNLSFVLLSLCLCAVKEP